MKLFDTNAIEQSKLEPKDHVEADFQYLETSARPMVGRIRDLLEEWFFVYPDEHKAELRQRFRAKNGVESPLFELTLYNTLFRMQADIQVHPSVEGTKKRPDFHVRLSSGFEFYLEAIVVRGASHKDLGQEQMVNTIYSIIDRKLRSPDFFLSVDVLVSGANTPKSVKLVNDLYKYLNTIDLGEATKVYMECGYKGCEAKYRTVWEYEGWHIEFVPLPKRDESAGNPNHRPLGVFVEDGGWLTIKKEIRSAIELKIKHHNQLTKPYIVAVNSSHWITNEQDFIDALYGSNTVQVEQDGSYTNKRSLDGVWRDQHGLKNEQLIAVIGVPILTATTLAAQSLVVYQNPYIKYPREAILGPLPIVFPRHGAILERRLGSSLGDIFGLSIDWPMAEPAD